MSMTDKMAINRIASALETIAGEGGGISPSPTPTPTPSGSSGYVAIINVHEHAVPAGR